MYIMYPSIMYTIYMKTMSQFKVRHQNKVAKTHCHEVHPTTDTTKAVICI